MKWCDVSPRDGAMRCSRLVLGLILPDLYHCSPSGTEDCTLLLPDYDLRSVQHYSKLLSPPVLVLVEVSPSRPLGACWRRCRCRRTAFSSSSSSQLLFKSSMLCSLLHGVVFRPIFSPPLIISTRSSAFFWTAEHFSILWFLLKAYFMVLPLSH